MYLFYFFLSETETVNIQAVDVFNFELEDAKIPPVSYFHFLSNINFSYYLQLHALCECKMTSRQCLSNLFQIKFGSLNTIYAYETI